MLSRESAAVAPEARLPRRPEGCPVPFPHEPLAREELTHFYAHYANRVRGEQSDKEDPRQRDEAEPPTRRRCSSTWARLIAKVFQADPLVCRRCGGPLTILAYVTDSLAIRQILDHLDMSPPEKPPPDIRDVVRVPVDDEGYEIEVQHA